MQSHNGIIYKNLLNDLILKVFLQEQMNVTYLDGTEGIGDCMLVCGE